MKRDSPTLELDDELAEILDRHAQTAGDLWERRHRALLDCLDKVAASDRQVLRLRYEEGGTASSVAAATGRSPNAIYKVLNRVHKQLLACIERTIRAEDREE